LHAMGADLASIHAATSNAAAAITADLKARRGGWLRDSVRAAREATEKDFEIWCRAVSA
jgi:hypothetical protein